MAKLPKPWQKDIFNIALSGTYNLKDKIIAGAELFYVGKRYAQPLSGTGIIDLNAVVDLNLSVEYRYTKMLSAFVHLNNITANTYYRWNQYPSQRFNFMIGISYAL
jgi:outer membrane receptor protein involved in Fe transport